MRPDSARAGTDPQQGWPSGCGPGRLRQRPESVLGDKAYGSKAVRRKLRRRRILPVISRKGTPNINQKQSAP
ncbi:MULTISPECIES: hypothetical protein [unclassified Streptomyces]|uniref:hypothetical protein n=1 Tax=unclassified Streptomyces TaxID=2593676 RepID=UPI0011C90886